MFLLNAGQSPWLQQFISWLIKQDQWLFVKINTTWTNAALDGFFPVWRESITWSPLYLFLLVFMLLNFGNRAWPWILFLIITATITDQVSSNFIKDWIARPRPCRDPDFSHYVRLLMNRCPISGSFTSSHATSHFGAAVFIAITLKEYLKNWKWLFFIWAFTISYGQVYIGVHYPLDVVGGGMLGCLIGFTTGTFCKKWVGLSLPGGEMERTIKL